MPVAKKIIITLLLPLVFIGGTNYLIDPDYTLRKDYIPSLVEALSTGKLVSGPMNINSRVLKKQWIDNLPFEPEVLVLGSSRTLGLSEQAFPGKSFFNASVTNCTFQDMYAFLNLFEKKQKRLPETVIICADQWLFGNAFAEKRWLNNRVDFVEMLQKASDLSERQFPSKWELQKEWMKELFSVRYLVRSLRQRRKTENFEICNSIAVNKMMFLPSGVRLLPNDVVNASESEIERRATDYFYSSRDEYFNELLVLQCQLFEDLVNYLKSKKCEVILYIPPYQPETYRLLQQSPQCKGVFKVDDYLLREARNYELKVAGATNPSKLNLSAADFYDGVHLKPEVLEDVFKQNQ
ncbi:hypothetical protein [Sunxiuqinia indica]|uniref:hypothetical protein n=1 Tax=Sunxiuqinia indica TaxID=2692584 RepID=UPI001356FADE|nr:hypothetical protein [Sunxiuqinia indica]